MSAHDLPKPDYTMAYNSGLLQGRAYKSLQNHLTPVLKTFNLSIPEWKVLGQLHAHDRVRLADLVNLTGYDPPLVTNLIHLLVRKRLAKRITDRNDRRAKIVSATALGMARIPQIEVKVKERIGMLMQGVSRHDLLTYVSVLEQIVENGRKLDSSLT